MKDIITWVVIFLIGLAVGYFVASDRGDVSGEPLGGEQEGEFMVDGETWVRHRAPEFGIQFAYRTNPNGYVLDERIPTEPDEAGFVRAFILLLEDDFEELQQNTAPREGPPTITLAVFENTENMFPRQWADAHPQYSNINLALTAIGTNPVAGANAIRYRADGLYVSDTIVVASGGYVYVASGSFIDEDSQIRRDFESFVSSLTFIPTEREE